MNPEQIEAVSRQLKWEWTDPQGQILANPTRFALISGGNRGGKSEFTARWLFFQVLSAIERGFANGETILFWLVAANYDKTRAEFTYLTDYLQRFFGTEVVDATAAVDPGRLTLDIVDGNAKGKIIVRTKSSADEMTLVMEAPAAIAVCEAAQVTYSAFLKLQGRIAEKRAPLMMSGTLENDLGWYVDLLNRWSSPGVWALEDSRSWVVPTHTNHFKFPGGETDPEILRLKAIHTEDEYNRQFMGVPSPPRGLVFPEFSMPVHVRDVPYVPGKPIWLVADPGIAAPAERGSAYAIECLQVIDPVSLPPEQVAEFRVVDKQIRVFHEFFVANMIEEDIIEQLVKKAYWWGQSPIFGVIDRSGATRAGAHEASVEVWRKLAGINMMYTEAAIPISDGIRRFKSFLRVDGNTGEPGMVIDVGNRGVISELGGGESPIRPGFQDQVYRWRTQPDGTIYGDDPRDEHCDGVKAIWYYLVHQFGYATAGVPRHVVKVKRHRAYR